MRTFPDRLLGGIAGLALALGLSGCVSSEVTVYRDVDRVKVEFENETAGRLFYEGLGKMKGRYDKMESRTEVSIPIIFEHKRRVIESENEAFNDAVRRCDTNGDGKITEQEARIFVDQLSQRP